VDSGAQGVDSARDAPGQPGAEGEGRVPRFGLGAYRSPRGGFTLLELLTALIIMGVASTVLLRMFMSSMTLAKTSSTHQIAADLAEEYATTLRSRPDLFDWPKFTEEQPGTPIAITPRASGPVQNVTSEPPAALPLLRRANEREAGTYRDFTWNAKGRIPSADAPYIIVDVEVVWELEGRLRTFVLETAVPRSTVERAAQ